MADFDPYYQWLAIPPRDRPPNHYRLLGVELFESNADVIATAADKQMAHVRSFQTGKHSALSQKLLNEIAAAKVCLLNPAKKEAYDRQLRPQSVAPPPAPPVQPGAASSPVAASPATGGRHGLPESTGTPSQGRAGGNASAVAQQEAGLAWNGPDRSGRPDLGRGLHPLVIPPRQ